MDTQRINHLLAEQKLELSFIGHELDCARAEVSRLEAKHSVTMEMVQKLEALRSPVRRMPTEIMTKVFEQCVQDEESQEPDPLRAPLLLCQVCSAWRDLMFSLPCLWRTLKVGFPPATPNWENVMQSRIMSMHVWLSHAKALPISLVLQHPSNSPITWGALMLLDKEILTLGCRIEELSLGFSPLALSSLLTFTQSPLPRLRHLELHNSNPLPSNDNPPPLSLHDAPNLRSLSIAWGSLDTTQFCVPWSQLTQLSLQYEASPYWSFVHNDHLNVLRECPNLRYCYIGIGMIIPETDTDRAAPVTLPNLESMKVRLFCQTLYTQQFFDALHAPKLHTFEFQNVSLAMGSFASQTEPLPFISRSAETLENLSLDTINISDVNMVTCLSQLHRLKHLRFLPGPLQLNHNLVDDLILSGTPEGYSICPGLESLSLKCSKRISTDRVTELVASRCSASPKLAQFCLQLAAFDYGQDSRDKTIAELRQRLNQYVEGGLQLHLMKAKPTG